MNIPDIPRDRVAYSAINGVDIPAAPFITVLLLKLQGWADHRISRRTDLQLKQYVDVRDIYELLEVAVQNSGMHVRNESWLPESFVMAGKRRVVQFTLSHSDSKISWRKIGLMSS